MATGYEEGETLTIVDLCRRAGIECHTFAFGDLMVTGMHNMVIKADKQFSDEVKDYDMIMLPGGRPGGANLAANDDVIAMLKWFNDNNKYIAAMCSGTTVLEKAQVITGKHVTGYTGYAEKLPSGIFEETVAVADQNVVTSQGPATPYPMAFKMIEVLGGDTTVLRERTLYNFAGGRKA